MTAPAQGWSIAAEGPAAAAVVVVGGATVVVAADGGAPGDADAVLAALRYGLADGGDARDPAVLLRRAWACAATTPVRGILSVLTLWIGGGTAVCLHAGDLQVHTLTAAEPPRARLRPHSTLTTPTTRPMRVRTRALGLTGVASTPELVELGSFEPGTLVVSSVGVWFALGDESLGRPPAEVVAASRSRVAAGHPVHVAARLVVNVPIAEVTRHTATRVAPAPVAIESQRRARLEASAILRRALAPRSVVLVAPRGGGCATTFAQWRARTPAAVTLTAERLARALRDGVAGVRALVPRRLLAVERIVDLLAITRDHAAFCAAVAHDELQLVTTATPDELARIEAVAPVLARALAPVTVAPPSSDELARIAASWAPQLAAHHSVTLPPERLAEAIALSDRFPLGRAQPEATLFLLEQACARSAATGGLLTTLVPTARGGRGGTVQRAALVASVADHARIPASVIDQTEAERLAALATELSGRVLGQDAATAQVAAAIARGHDAATPRPRATLLLSGPSGTGKTETARVLASHWCCDADALLVIDLSEFQDSAAPRRLIGAPPGYLGYGERTELDRWLERRPRSVVLFDELDKAHPSVLDLLLQVLEGARLTTGDGRRLDFTQAIVVLTSNLLATDKAIGVRPQTPDERDERAERAALSKVLRPELVGRLDAVIRFAALDATSALRIAMTHVARVEASLVATGRLPRTELPALRRDISAELGRRTSFPGGARDVLRIVQDAIREASARAAPARRDELDVVYPCVGGARDLHATGLRVDAAAGSLRTVIGEVLGHPASTDLLFAASFNGRLIAVFGSDAAAHGVANDLARASLTPVVATGRCSIDLAGRARGELIDALVTEGSITGAEDPR